MRIWNRLPHLARSLLALALAGAALAAAVGAVWAHEGRDVHGFTFDVGFLVEPAYEGQPNAVYLSVTRAGGGDHHAAGSEQAGGTEATAGMAVQVTAEVAPIDGINVNIVPSGFVSAPENVNQAHAGVSGLADTLRVDVTHLAADMSASGVSRQMALTPLPEAEGRYAAPFIPTVPGPYRFRFIGTIDGMAIDETFTSGPGTFDDVRSAAEAQFPRPVPSAREVAGVAAAAQQEAQEASDASTMALTVAVVGLVIGGLGLLLGAALALSAFRRRSGG